MSVSVTVSDTHASSKQRKRHDDSYVAMHCKTGSLYTVMQMLSKFEGAVVVKSVKLFGSWGVLQA